MYKVYFENVERFLSNEVRLKLRDDADAKGIIIVRLLFFERQTSLKYNKLTEASENSYEPSHEKTNNVDSA